MKKALRLITFSILAVFAILGTYRVLSWKDTTGGYLSSTQQLYATEDNLIDAVFMGSSHCYCSVNPAILWNEYGMSAFDMSVSGQDKDSNYYVLKELLKTQSPKVICIDAYALLFDKQAVLGNAYRNMLSMKLSPNSNDLIHSYVDEEEQKDYLLRWPIIHTRYRELGKFDFIQYEPSIYGRGFYHNYNISPIGLSAEARACTDVIELNEQNRRWLDNLIALSEEEGFELVMFLAPFYLSVENQAIINGASAYLAEHDIAFLDFNRLADEVGFDYNVDFTDSQHTNSFGAAKVTSYLGNYLHENYSFTDHRGDDAYYLWEENSRYDAHRYNAYLISIQSDLAAYLSTIAECPDLTVVISLDGDYKSSTLDIKSALTIMGISESEYETGGKWVFENGEQIFYMDNASEEVFLHDLSKTDTLRIRNDFTPVTGTVNGRPLDQIQINNTPYSSCYSGVSILVYDNFTKEVINKKGYF